jgi:hypothetical protein
MMSMKILIIVVVIPLVIGLDVKHRVSTIQADEAVDEGEGWTEKRINGHSATSMEWVQPDVGGEGVCGLSIFVGLPTNPTWQNARDHFYTACMSGAGKHPQALCTSGTLELFEGYNLAAPFQESPGSSFCSAVANTCEAHERWKEAKIRQSLLLRHDLTEEQKQEVMACEEQRFESTLSSKKRQGRRPRRNRRRPSRRCMLSEGI